MTKTRVDHEQKEKTQVLFKSGQGAGPTEAMEWHQGPTCGPVTLFADFLGPLLLYS